MLAPLAVFSRSATDTHKHIDINVVVAFDPVRNPFRFSWAGKLEVGPG